MSNNPHDMKDVNREGDMFHSIGYLIAKFESLDQFIRDHMQAEERKFQDMYRRMDEMSKSLQKLKIFYIVLAISVALVAGGVTLPALVPKLIGAIL